MNILENGTAKQGNQALDLDKIVHMMMADERNRSYTERGIPPILQLSPKAKILIVGQAPGRKVEESRIPFNDKSGETLMRWLGIDRACFYSEKIAIMPMDFYFPGKGKSGDLPPRPFVAREYHAQLLALMKELRLTILVGKYAIDYYLGQRKRENLTETVRNFADYAPDYFPIVHPSPLNFRWQRNNPWFEAEVVPRLRQAVSAGLSEAH